MNRSALSFLQAVIVGLGILALAALLWEPHLEGRNAGASLFEIYFKDPFLAYAYLASIPFLVGLYQAFKVLGYAGRHQVFSNETAASLRIIRRCAVVTAGAILAADVYLVATAKPEDDPAGAIMLGMIATFITVVVAAAATVFGRMVENVRTIKSENDLTV